MSQSNAAATCQQSQHAPTAAQTEVEPSSLIFQVGDQGTDALPCDFGISGGADVGQFDAVDADRRPTQTAAPVGVGVIVVGELLLQAVQRLARAWIGERQVNEIHVGNRFAPRQQRIEGKGHDLRLTAQGGDQRGGMCEFRVGICHDTM
jgi:hypothetical protein